MLVCVGKEGCVHMANQKGPKKPDKTDTSQVWLRSLILQQRKQSHYKNKS